MPAPVIDAVGVTSRDMARTLAFYRRLGFDFPEPGPEDQHIEAITAPGAVRLMIDAEALATSLIGAPPRPSNHAVFALLCESPAELDRIAATLAEAGDEIVTPPFDAFWGQRYATVADPDGYRIDLFAALSAG